MSTSSNHTKAFVQYCHGKYKVGSSRTVLSVHVHGRLHIRTKENIFAHKKIRFKKPLTGPPRVVSSSGEKEKCFRCTNNKGSTKNIYYFGKALRYTVTWARSERDNLKNLQK